jgi:Holliday junction resolvase RusA-like endonuclease
MMLARPSVQFVSLDLPAPISANALWRSYPTAKGLRVVKSKAYLDWLSEAGWKLNAQHPGMVEGAYGLTITVCRSSRCDLDNTAKATNDLLQAHGVIVNDRLAQKILIQRGDVEGMRVLVISANGET